DSLDELIADDQQHNIRYEPTAVPAETCPFNTEAQNVFMDALHNVIEAGIIPENFGLQEDEWEGGSYPDSELIKVGRKVVRIDLPFNV
ncbi:hypothetical protein BDQ17DRAFT_1177689, partial [Cyathus striatus]